MSSKPAVRAETPDDRDQVRRVVAAAFGGDKVPGLVAALRESVAWLDLAYVAEQHDEVVGHVSYTRGWVDARPELVEVLVLSPVAVRPERQRPGSAPSR